MMKKSFIIFPVVAVLIVIAFWLTSDFRNLGSQQRKGEKKTKSSSFSTSDMNIEKLAVSELYIRKRDLNSDLLDLLEVFQNGDDEDIAQKVLELLEKDLAKAIDLFSKLDDTTVFFKKQFPHDLVADYLKQHLPGVERMELVGGYLTTSFTIRHLGKLVCREWALEDPEKHFDWISVNRTFDDHEFLYDFVTEISKSEEGPKLLDRIDKMDPSDYRRSVMLQDSLVNLATKQPGVFADYINKQEVAPPEATQALSSHAYYLLETEEPDAALEWIGIIEDANYREAITEVVAARLYLEQPEMFKEWWANTSFVTRSKEEMWKSIQDSVYMLENVESVPDVMPQGAVALPRDNS